LTDVSRGRRVVVTLGLVSGLTLGALEIVARRPGAPWLLIPLVASTAIPFRDACRAARGTALWPSLVWTALALAFLFCASGLAIREPLSDGRPGAGRLTYFSVLCLLAAFVSVLNARVPGNQVWAGLMALLVLIFLIPWLEASLRMRRAQELALLRLDSPWTLFYGFMVTVGVTNYVPTRFALAAVGFAVTFFLEYLGLTRLDWPPERRAILWSWVAWTFVLSVWVARWRAFYRPADRVPFERLWFWFRDAWGVVWALRIQERFNRTAELKGWPLRLSWFGLVMTGPSPGEHPVTVPGEAITDFRSLIRRFAEVERVEKVLRGW
jgi:hypothetical protein